MKTCSFNFEGRGWFSMEVYGLWTMKELSAVPIPFCEFEVLTAPVSLSTTFLNNGRMDWRLK